MNGPRPRTGHRQLPYCASARRGRHGAVYEVEHVKLGVRYGLKTYILEDGNAELFRKRFQAYVMDLVLYKDGEAYTLDDLEDGGADEEHLVQWFAELCDARV